jgi:hypothetical protein
MSREERRFRLFLNIVIYGVAAVSLVRLLGRGLIHPRRVWSEFKSS